MIDYILREEYFGGVLIDVCKFQVYFLNRKQFFITEYMNRNNDHFRIIKNFTKKGVLSAPTSITVYPSLKCNYNCSFCFARPLSGIYRQDMSFFSFKQVVEQAKDMGICDIEIMGGEPFLLPWIYDAIKYIDKLGLHCSINTNGSNISEDLISKLSEIRNLSFRLSIQDNFDKIHVGQKLLLDFCNKYNFSIDILSVVQKETCDKYNDLFLQLPKNVVKNIILLYNSPGKGCVPDYSTIWFYKKVKEIQEKNLSGFRIVPKGPYAHYDMVFTESMTGFENGICLATVTRVEIMPNGDVIPCAKYYYNKKDVLGNVFYDDLKNIWLSEKSCSFRNFIHNIKHKECNCLWKDNCSGCPGYFESLNIIFDDRCPKNVR